MYHYVKSEPGLWTVGTGEGKTWEPDSDYTSREEAAQRVAYLNGSGNVSAEALQAKINALSLNLQGLCDLLEGIKPHIDAMPEKKRRMVPGAYWIEKAIANARQVMGGRAVVAQPDSDSAEWIDA